MTTIRRWFVVVLLFVGRGRHIQAADDTVRTSAMAMVSERGRLPCDVTSELEKDRANLVLWYRDTSGTPIYSFDARGKELDGGKRWFDERLLENRAYFQVHRVRGRSGSGPGWSSRSPSSAIMNSSFGAHLELYPVKDRDQAIYRCRVDFLLSPTKNTIVNFTVIIPPNKPEIYNDSDHLVGGGSVGASLIGPYNEGSPLILTCKVSGGRPPPEVQWLVNDELSISKTVRVAGGVMKNTLIISKLSRRDLHAVFECRASNYNESTPVSSAVTLDMNFKPLNVSVLSGSGPLSEGTEYELTCQAWGSRPSAIITWWKGGTIPMKNDRVTTSPDSNITTSILKYVAKMTDNHKYVTCRAENKLIEGSAREDGLKLNIYYKPVVTLQMGSNLNPDNIKEGDDVYFECHINANPEVQRVLWFHNGVLMEPRVVQGIIIQNQTLVLQRIAREAAGFYTCRATNLEGEGESLPVELRVMYKPYCHPHEKMVYGTALHEAASVLCEVDANPGPVTFRWTFNNTSEHLPISASSVTSKDFTSIATYAPKSHLDFGTLLCWAFNSIGEQASPCVFSIIPAGKPDPLKNCSITNQTTDAIVVECTPGFDGGLPQNFYMEVYGYEDNNKRVLHRNISSLEPLYILTSLQPGLAFLMVTYAANAKGRSATTTLETVTMKVAEKRTGPPSIFEFTPVLGVLIGVVLALILTALVIVAVMRLRRPRQEGEDEMRGGGGGGGGGGSSSGEQQRQQHKHEMETKPLNASAVDSRSRDVIMETEENDPDLIPHKSDMVQYADYDAIDRGGPLVGATVEVVPNMRTLPRPSPTNHYPPHLFQHHHHHQHQFQQQQPLLSQQAAQQQMEMPAPSEITFVEVNLPRGAQSGIQARGNDVCVYAAIDHRNSTGPSSPYTTTLCPFTDVTECRTPLLPKPPTGCV